MFKRLPELAKKKKNLPGRPARGRKKKPTPRGTKLAANVMEEEWDRDGNLNLGRAFLVVFALHIVAVLGILAFHFIEAAGTQVSADGASPSGTSRSGSGPDGIRRPAPPEGSVAYIAAAGDTTKSIAARYGIGEKELLEVNPTQLPGKVKKDTPVYIPQAALAAAGSGNPGEGSNPAATPARPATPASTAPPRPRVVEEGASGARPAQPAARTRPANLPPLDADGLYVVKSGDNPYSIARRFGVSEKELEKLNKIEDPTKVQIGTRLRIPGLQP